jgi:phage tail-like protein
MSPGTLGGDLPVANRFLFEVDGQQIGVFSEVSGLEMKVDTDEWKELGENEFTHQFPGRKSWNNIVMRRGITDSDALFKWVGDSGGDGFKAKSNKLKRSTGAITALSTENKRLRSWQLRDVFPIRWTGPKFDVTSADYLQEEIEITHNGFTSKTF